MLGLGFTETIVLAGIILIVMGPEKFPGVAKTIIRTVRDVRGYWDDAQREFTKEINPLKKEVKSLSRYKPEDFIDSLAGKDADKKPEELDPALKEPGASGYGVKVPDIDKPGPDPNNPYGGPASSEPQPQPYAPPMPNASHAVPAEEDEDDDDGLGNPPPRLET